MNFNQAKIISVYYNKGDRKPYDVNGKPIAYIGEEFIGSTEATTIRFYLGEDIDSSTATIVTKRADGERRLDICSKVGTGEDSYYEVTLNSWYSAVKGKLVVVFKAYNGEVEFDDEENPTEILSVTGRIVVSDIFNLDIGYAPVADLVVPADDTEPYEDWFFALSTKLDKADSITVAGALPTLTGDAYDDRYFYIEDEGVGRLYYINGSTAEEVVFQVGTLRLTPDAGSSTTADTGKLSWEDEYGSLKLGLYNENYLNIGQDLEYYGKASGDIAKGMAVQFAGIQGNHYTFKEAVQSEINANPKLMMGIAKEDIDNNDFGYVLHFGRIRNIDTGDYNPLEQNLLWFNSGGSTPGELTITQPTAPNAKILMAVVVKIANNGIILVRPTFEPKLSELQDIHITSIADNQILRWNSANSRWENSSELTTAETDIDNLEGRMDTAESDIDSLESRMTTAENDIDDIEDGTTVVPKALADQNGDVINTTYLRSATASSTYIPLSQKGVANGVVPLGSNGKVPSQYLSGEQDDLAEYDSLEDFPEVGETDILYVALDTNKLYRWSGSAYVVISETLALGTTSTTAFRGDLGQTAYDNADTALDNTLNIIDGTQTLTDTRVTNSATNVVPLIVNTLPSHSTNLQEWQVNGSQVSRMNLDGRFATTTGMGNSGSSNYAYVNVANNGTIISRNIADANPSLIVNLANASSTGDILRLQFAGANKLEITKDGFINQNGTRLLTTPGTQNLFFGVNSGNLSTTGSQITSIGTEALSNITSGSLSVAVGHRALLSSSTGSSNVAVGVNSGRSITTGGTNTFVGRDSGYNASQLVSASNSTAVGFEAYTNKSNQMVFGNSSVSEFVFNRNTSAVLIAPNIGIGVTPLTKLHIAGAGSQELRIENTNTTVGLSDVIGTLSFRSNDASSGGTGIAGSISSISEASSGVLYGLAFNTKNFASETEKMRITNDGKVGIGTSSPASLLSLRSSGDTYLTIDTNLNANNAGIRLSESSTPTTNGAELVYDGSANLFHIKTGGASFTERLTIVRDSGNVGIGTSSPATQLEVALPTTTNGVYETTIFKTLDATTPANTGSLHFSSGYNSDAGLRYSTIQAKRNNGAFTSNLILQPSGSNVGINETSPSAQLQVKSCATTRVPLIVDTLASHATNLQEWKVNNITQIFIDQYGVMRAEYVANKITSNNALIHPSSSGTLISRNVADTNPALTVNLANASATGNIQVWQKAGVAQAYISNDGTFATSQIRNYTTINNALITPSTTGTTISRNIADSNPALVVNQNNSSSTGKIVSFRFNGVEKSYIDKDGNFSGATIIPSYTLLGSRISDGTLTVTDIDTFDEIQIRVELYVNSDEIIWGVAKLPVADLTYANAGQDREGVGAVCIDDSGTIASAYVFRNNTDGTQLDIKLRNASTVKIYGVNY